MPSPNKNSPSEPALEALAKFIDTLDIPIMSEKELAQDDKAFRPALVNGQSPISTPPKWRPKWRTQHLNNSISTNESETTDQKVESSSLSGCTPKWRPFPLFPSKASELRWISLCHACSLSFAGWIKVATKVADKWRPYFLIKVATANL